MVKLIFVENDGTHHDVNADIGSSVMQVAVDNAIPSIVGECGGTLSCGTCHCYIDEARASELEPMSDHEQELIEGVLDIKTNSRLSCQLIVTDTINGMMFHLPASQY